ncbi:MAG: hypothetical protein RL662_1925 [Bacteroidota bacterium]|jgi:hypothetical protein
MGKKITPIRPIVRRNRNIDEVILPKVYTIFFPCNGVPFKDSDYTQRGQNKEEDN